MDGLEDIPFGPQPEEKLPLVVPDTTPVIPARVPCSALTKAGLPCPTPVVKGGTLCMGHTLKGDKAKMSEYRQKSAGVKRIRKSFTVSLGGHTKPMTVSEVLLIISRRIELHTQRFGEVMDPAADEILCDLARTYVAVYKCNSDEAATGIAAQWNLKRRQA